MTKIYDLGYNRDIYKTNEVYFTKMEGTGWLQILSRILKASFKVVDSML